MAMETINPVTGKTEKRFDSWDAATLERALQQVADATNAWADTPIAERAKPMRRLAKELRDNKHYYASLITLEMGKPITEAVAEVEKCALGCEYYADNAADFLADETIETDASRSYVAYLPIGTVLAVMPWNFPLWQVYRFAGPALMAGNTGVLKHASNVPQCALAIEESFRKAGFPDNVFRTLMIPASMVQQVIEDPRVHATTLTGSEPAGRQVAGHSGANLKKSLLELGGSDAFVVLEDADLEQAAHWGVVSRYLNDGQSCIAAKRFIVVDAIADEYLKRFKQKAEQLVVGDPMNEKTQVGPMSRADLRDALHKQVTDSIAQGAVKILGCEIPKGAGSYYPPSILDGIKPGMRAYEEELFGPVALFIHARDEADALRIANDTRFGLAGSVWTRDIERGNRFAKKMQSGASFVNGMSKSDPRLPFGGIKASGYGRELSHHGIHEFVNAKTIWIG